jgi:hypothetical protein
VVGGGVGFNFFKRHFSKKDEADKKREETYKELSVLVYLSDMERSSSYY